MKKTTILTLIGLITVIDQIAAASDREEVTTEKVSELTTTNFNRTNEDIVLIGPNGGPVIQNPSSGGKFCEILACKTFISHLVIDFF